MQGIECARLNYVLYTKGVTFKRGAIVVLDSDSEKYSRT